MSGSGVYTNSFAEVFSSLLKQTDLSCYKISEYTHLDQGYLSRLKNGEKENPSPETVIKISMAFAHFSKNVGISDIQRLFRSVGRSIAISEI